MILYPAWRTDSLVAFEEVRLSRWRVVESSIDLVFGQTGADVLQAVRGTLLHGRLSEDPVPIACDQK